MKNFIQPGHYLEVRTGKSYKSGDLYVEGNLVGIAITNNDGPIFSIATTGVYELPKAKEALKIGQKLYSKDGSPLTSNDKETIYVGICLSNSEPGEGTTKVKIG